MLIHGRAKIGAVDEKNGGKVSFQAFSFLNGGIRSAELLDAIAVVAVVGSKRQVIGRECRVSCDRGRVAPLLRVRVRREGLSARGAGRGGRRRRSDYYE